jgi:hypothetical protein
MFYLKINEKIKQLIELLNEQHIGCKYYCSLQIIALDELDFLRRDLESKKIKTLSNDEFEEIKKSSDKLYFHNTHICKPSTEEANKNYSSEAEDENLLEELQKDKINTGVKKDVFESSVDYEYLAKKKDEENSKALIRKDDSSVSFAFNMLGSFFLIVFGSYYMGKYVFDMPDKYNYILVLIVSIVVFIAEAVLLMIKLHKDSMIMNAARGNLKENSFAYRFNKSYRNKFVKTKVYNKEKSE